MVNIIIALLVEKGLFSAAEGEALAEKIRFATLPSDYATATKLIRTMLTEVEKGI